MSIEPLDVLLAIAPPLVVLVLMVGFRWGGSKAGPVGWIVALGIAFVSFGADGEVLGWAHVRAFILTVDVVMIVWAALLLYFVVREAGSLDVISRWFSELTSDDVLRVLLLGWIFTGFLQGVGGFGVPVAIVAPLLVGLGLRPLSAIVIPSIGHAWAVTFGSLGSSFIMLINVTDLSGEILAPTAALLLGGGAIICGLVVSYAYAGWYGLRRGIPAVLIVGSVMAVVQYVVATNGLWTIGSAVAGLVGLIVGYMVTRMGYYRDRSDSHEHDTISQAVPWERSTTTRRNRPNFSQAILGYTILVILAFMIKGIEPLNEVMEQTTLSVSIPELETSEGWITESGDVGIPIFAHTGTILLYSAIITFLFYRLSRFYNRGAYKIIFKGVRTKGVRPAIGILSMVAMATIMSNAGMTRTFAEWMSGAVPADLYAFVSTGIGSLGAFMTGSNTNSNAVFAGLQKETATLLGLSIPVVLGIQTASAAIASLLAPAKIMVGASTVNMKDGEGQVLRSLLVYGGLILIFIAVFGFILLEIGFEG